MRKGNNERERYKRNKEMLEKTKIRQAREIKIYQECVWKR